MTPSGVGGAEYKEPGSGIWQPACPAPLWSGIFLRVAHCECGKRFKPPAARGHYRDHWFAAHAPRDPRRGEQEL